MSALARLLLSAYPLKRVERAGWLRVGIEQPESVAAHSWGMALLALATCPPTLDRERVVALCLLHDIAEAVVGDITPHDGISREEKRARESQAAAEILGDHPGLLALWQEYESQSSEEARFARSLDKLDMGVQASVYRSAADTSEFVESARPGLDEKQAALLEQLWGA